MSSHRSHQNPAIKAFISTFSEAELKDWKSGKYAFGIEHWDVCRNNKPRYKLVPLSPEKVVPTRPRAELIKDKSITESPYLIIEKLMWPSNKPK